MSHPVAGVILNMSYFRGVCHGVWPSSARHKIILPDHKSLHITSKKGKGGGHNKQIQLNLCPTYDICLVSLLYCFCLFVALLCYFYSFKLNLCFPYKHFSTGFPRLIFSH